MSLLTIISGRISRNSIRVASKNITLTPAAALAHSKAEPAVPLDGERVVKIVTRKKYKELPTFKKLSDGSIASALDEWPGGLEVPKMLSDIRSDPETSGARHFSSIKS